MVRLGRVSISVLAAFLLGAPAAAQQGAVGLGDVPEQLRAASEIKGLSFVLMSRLPRAPGGRARVSCEGQYSLRPKTEAGRAVKALGWAVTGEAPFGPFSAVSFAGTIESATSGTCVIGQGNVALFRAGEPVALVYAAKGSQLSVGRIDAGSDGSLLIRDGEPPHIPIARIDRRNEGYLLRLGALAAEEKVCGGKAVVPNIYTMPIDVARRALIRSGWTPVPGDPANDDSFGREAELRKRGVPEVEGCSGTGFGYCSFTYKGPGGKLSVTTMGDGDFPTVTDYGAECS